MVLAELFTMRKKKKFYAVRNGRKPGLYRSWEECSVQVDGYSNADYRRFPTQKSAEDYLKGLAPRKSPASESFEIETVVKIPQFLPAPAHDDARLKQVVMYSDGACVGNPGPGGYGVVLIHGDRRKELSAGFRLTTNNRMEILGCIVGLRALKEPCAVTIYSDSKYVVNTMAKSWALKWRSRGWKRKGENGELKDALNADLWSQMLDLCDRHRVTFKWVRGHDGNEGNERCDQLARAAAAGPLGVDALYEQPRKADASDPRQQPRIENPAERPKDGLASSGTS